MKPKSFNTTLAQSKLVVNKYSRPIFKQKPKIRIIHIVEPEIIKTDVHNFQELVQRLTGKLGESKERTNSGKKASPPVLHPKPCCSKKAESEGAPIALRTQKVKEESEVIYEDGNENGFLSLIGELDGFLHDMNEFPLLSLSSSQVNTMW